MSDLQDLKNTGVDNINLKKTSGAQLAAKKIVKKYRNLATKKPPVTTEFGNLETIDYNKDTSINDLNDIAKLKPGKSAQIAAKKISEKYKKIRSKKPPLPFKLTDVVDAETVDYNKDTSLIDVASNKSAQIAATKISDKYKKIRSKRKDVTFIKQVPVHPRDRMKRKIKIKM